MTLLVWLFVSAPFFRVGSGLHYFFKIISNLKGILIQSSPTVRAAAFIVRVVSIGGQTAARHSRCFCCRQGLRRHAPPGKSDAPLQPRRVEGLGDKGISACLGPQGREAKRQTWAGKKPPELAPRRSCSASFSSGASAAAAWPGFGSLHHHQAAGDHLPIR